ncbi:pyridoxal-phosphate dependent enzyme [Bacteroidota bacterium]
MQDNIPVLDDIIDAYNRIKYHIHRTPVLTSESINKILGTEIFFKCDNFQKVGAFKFRGALNAVSLLSDEELKKGVATHSSGNYAAALTLAASLKGSTAYIVMPENAPEIKKKAVAGYGAKITFCKPSLEARESTLEKIVAETGAVFLHPFNDHNVIAGQGTASLEFLEDCPDLDLILAPLGGGGLLSGTAIYCKESNSGIEVIGVEPKGADDAYRSLKAGRILPSVNPQTIADGLLTSLGNKTFKALQKYVDDVILVEEESIVEAMRLVWERMKIIIEPSSAVPLAGILENKGFFKGKKTGIIISGGNVDINDLPF